MSERRTFSLINFQHNVIVDWENAFPHSHLHHTSEEEEAVSPQSIFSIRAHVALIFDLMFIRRWWRREEVRAGEGREKRGLLGKLENRAPRFLTSESWIRGSAPACRRISELSGRLCSGHNRMWLKRTNERGKLVFDTVETLTLYTQPKIGLQMQREASWWIRPTLTSSSLQCFTEDCRCRRMIFYHLKSWTHLENRPPSRSVLFWCSFLLIIHLFHKERETKVWSRGGCNMWAEGKRRWAWKSIYVVSLQWSAFMCRINKTVWTQADLKPWKTLGIWQMLYLPTHFKQRQISKLCMYLDEYML